MDGAGPTQSAPGAPLLQAARPARWALGDTLRYANLIDLLAMEPRGELASTGYALANPGVEYLIVITAAHAPDLTVLRFRFVTERGVGFGVAAEGDRGKDRGEID